MIVGSQWKELQGKRRYIATDKDPPVYENDKESLAYWMLASRINETFGGQPATVGEIYYGITRPLRMSSSDTADLVTQARRAGYLKIE